MKPCTAGQWMAAWQPRVSYAPSAVTLPMGWSAGIWFSSSGNIPHRFARTGGAYRLDIADPAAVRRFARTGGAHLLTFDRPDLQRVRIDARMDLAPPLGECLHSPAGQRLPRLGRPVFLGKPLTIALGLDPLAGSLEPLARTGSLSIRS